ncbi:MAG: hypothetical protein RI637_02570 [Acidimicrobiia bacterium]|nr:hypothetical protein [Acidimicrobiia bacterium]
MSVVVLPGALVVVGEGVTGEEGLAVVVDVLVDSAVISRGAQAATTKANPTINGNVRRMTNASRLL